MGDNISGYINFGLDNANYSRTKMINEMKRRYPNAPLRSINAAYDHVISSRQAGRKQNRLQDDSRLNKGDIPTNPNIPQRYRYTVRLEWTDSQTGSVRYFNAIVDSNSLLSPTELANSAANQAESIRAMSVQHDDRYRYRFPAVTSIVFDSVTVERR